MTWGSGSLLSTGSVHTNSVGKLTAALTARAVCGQDCAPAAWTGACVVWERAERQLQFNQQREEAKGTLHQLGLCWLPPCPTAAPGHRSSHTDAGFGCWSE